MVKDLSKLLENYSQEILSTYSRKALQQAYKDLFDFYTACKQGKNLNHPAFITEEQRLAYVFCRMPATYVVIQHIFSDLQKIVPLMPSYRSFLDVGCGSGAGIWAALECWPQITHITAVDQDKGILTYAQQLLQRSAYSSIPSDWIHQTTSTASLQPQDIILLSYVFNENHDVEVAFLQNLWQSCQGLFIIIEPGTPKGFQNCLKIRQLLIDQGAFIIAPCGHEGQCPLQYQKDWCHFEQRLERLSLHQWIKEGTLGYEDEAYSYIVASRHPVAFQPRIIRPPLKRSKQKIIDLCFPDRLKRLILTKSHPLYKDKKAQRWGQRLNLMNKASD